MLSMKVQQTLITSLDCDRLRGQSCCISCQELASQGEKVRVVSMPSTDVFDKQDAAYKEKFFQMQFAVVLQLKWVQLKTGTNMLG